MATRYTADDLASQIDKLVREGKSQQAIALYNGANSPMSFSNNDVGGNWGTGEIEVALSRIWGQDQAKQWFSEMERTGDRRAMINPYTGKFVSNGGMSPAEVDQLNAQGGISGYDPSRYSAKGSFGYGAEGTKLSQDQAAQAQREVAADVAAVRANPVGYKSSSTYKPPTGSNPLPLSAIYGNSLYQAGMGDPRAQPSSTSPMAKSAVSLPETGGGGGPVQPPGASAGSRGVNPTQPGMPSGIPYQPPGGGRGTRTPGAPPTATQSYIDMVLARGGRTGTGTPTPFQPPGTSPGTRGGLGTPGSGAVPFQPTPQQVLERYLNFFRGNSSGPGGPPPPGGGPPGGGGGGAPPPGGGSGGGWGSIPHNNPNTYTGLAMRGFDPSLLIKGMRQHLQGKSGAGQVITPQLPPNGAENLNTNNLNQWLSIFQRG